MKNWSFNEESKSGVLTIDDDMTINHVGTLKEQLVEAFSQADKVTINVTATPAVDVAGLQLLCACHRFSCAKGKEMCLQLDGNDRFIAFIEEVGFSQEFFCKEGNAEECLWSSLN